MVRETSKDSYKQITNDGLLGGKQLEIYSYLYEHGPLTGNEIFKGLKSISWINQANIPARLFELKQFGVVKETGKRLCNVTGKKVLEFDVTTELPDKSNLSINNKERINRLEKAFKMVKGFAPNDVLNKAHQVIHYGYIREPNENNQFEFKGV